MMKLQTLTMTVLASAFAMTAQAETIWSAEGFDWPESAIVLQETGQIVVSNMVGSPLEPDGNGFLSLLSASGEVIEKQWITGMHAPKGMAIAGGHLFAADLDTLRIVDLATGTLVNSIKVDGAGLLNDVTSDGENVYISDMLTHTIWRYSDGSVEPILQGGSLTHPNGLLWDQDRLLIGNWGPGMKEDFSTDAPGDLIAWTPGTDKVEVIVSQLANIDGVIRLNGKFLVNDWITGEIFEVSDSGDVSKTAQFGQGLADIGAGDGVILMPHMLTGKVEALAIK